MDTEAIRRQTAVIDAARKDVEATLKLIAQATGRHGQDCAAIHVNGVKFDLTVLNRAYMPEAVKGMESIQRQCVDMLKAQLSAQKSKLDGSEWRLKQLIKAG